MEQTIQESLDALIEQFGAESVISAISDHTAHPDGNSGCKPGYILVNGVCKLDLGGGL